MESGCGEEQGAGDCKAGDSRAGVLFPLLEPPELALNSKGRLLRFRCRQIDVDLLILLGLLGAVGFACRWFRDL